MLYALTFDAVLAGRGMPAAQLAADEPAPVDAGVTPTGLQKPPDALLGSQRTALKPSSSALRLLCASDSAAPTRPSAQVLLISAAKRGSHESDRSL